ncbi:MAG: hypothetical protein WA823_15525 [Candidatus Acidiferrales bacterium]
MAAPKSSSVMLTMLQRLAEDERKSSTNKTAGTVGTVASRLAKAAVS